MIRARETTSTDHSMTSVQPWCLGCSWDVALCERICYYHRILCLLTITHTTLLCEWHVTTIRIISLAIKHMTSTIQCRYTRFQEFTKVWVTHPPLLLDSSSKQSTSPQTAELCRLHAQSKFLQCSVNYRFHPLISFLFASAVIAVHSSHLNCNCNWGTCIAPAYQKTEGASQSQSVSWCP